MALYLADSWRWTNLLKRSLQARRYKQVSFMDINLNSLRVHRRDRYHFWILYHETQFFLKNRWSLNQDSPKPSKHTKMTVWFCSVWKLFMSVFISEAVQKLRHKMPFPPFYIYLHLNHPFCDNYLPESRVDLSSYYLGPSLYFWKVYDPDTCIYY